MIGYAPGGSAEAGARPLARALEPILGQPLVFEYRPGNAGGVAMEAISRASPDGYTIYYFDSGPLTVAPHLSKVGYHNLNSFTHLGHVCGSGSLLVVHPSTPFKRMQDVIELSKKEPNKWSYGTSGVGGPHHLRRILQERDRREPAARAIQGRRPRHDRSHGRPGADALPSLGPAVGAVKSGKIRALAVTSPSARPRFPTCRR